MGRVEWLPEKATGKFTPALLRDDRDVDPARIGVYAGDMPSAARDHAPSWSDHPRGWTVQQPWFHPEFPPPEIMRCIRCAQDHKPGDCEVTRVLVALAAGEAP